MSLNECKNLKIQRVRMRSEYGSFYKRWLLHVLRNADTLLSTTIRWFNYEPTIDGSTTYA